MAQSLHHQVRTGLILFSILLVSIWGHCGERSAEVAIVKRHDVIHLKTGGQLHGTILLHTKRVLILATTAGETLETSVQTDTIARIERRVAANTTGSSPADTDAVTRYRATPQSGVFTLSALAQGGGSANKTAEKTPARTKTTKNNAKKKKRRRGLPAIFRPKQVFQKEKKKDSLDDEPLFQETESDIEPLVKND